MYERQTRAAEQIRFVIKFANLSGTSARAHGCGFFIGEEATHGGSSSITGATAAAVAGGAAAAAVVGGASVVGGDAADACSAPSSIAVRIAVTTATKGGALVELRPRGGKPQCQSSAKTAGRPGLTMGGLLRPQRRGDGGGVAALQTRSQRLGIQALRATAFHEWLRPQALEDLPVATKVAATPVPKRVHEGRPDHAGWPCLPTAERRAGEPRLS
mmetsp:Transcript_95274/g.269301  ORF Transcript_95274/g.269301 Transcript_95274/m.269301 type:complete len:215 (-) Transcript_95274:889-1533(-)